jgi:universal stress protein E
MGQYNRIAVILDPAMRESSALWRGAELARKTGARLYLCLYDYDPLVTVLLDPAIVKSAIDRHMLLRRRWIADIAERFRREGINVECTAQWGKHRAELIIRSLLKIRPDLVVKDTHPIPPLVRAVYTPLDWRLLQLCPYPLMLVNARGAVLPQRIIAAVDPVEENYRPHEMNQRVMEAANALALQCNAALHAAYVFAFIPPAMLAMPEAPMISFDKFLEASRQHKKAAFDQLMGSFSVPADRRHFIESISVEVGLSEFAANTWTDLVVMGTIHRTGYERLMLGSTAERVLYRLDCDVLAVKPASFLERVVAKFGKDSGEVLDYSDRAA